MTLSKNPMLMQSVNYVYNWFLTKANSEEQLSAFSLLDEVDGDITVNRYLKKNNSNKVRYENVEARHNGVSGGENE